MGEVRFDVDSSQNLNNEMVAAIQEALNYAYVLSFCECIYVCKKQKAYRGEESFYQWLHV